MNSFDPNRFEKSIPSVIRDTLSIFISHGFVPVAVGGIVRDFLLTGNLGHDWDFEIHHQSLPFNKDNWKELGKELSRLGRVTFLNFEVIRLESQNYQLEFSPPRKEIFFDDWNHKGHSNFTAEFDFRFSFEDSIKRRDFSINAIGIEFGKDSIQLIDPTGGVLHLREKTLYSCGPDFIKDPVRFFRAIRFSLKLKFELSSELAKLLRDMPVHTISSTYLWSEMNKSGDPIQYLGNLLTWQKIHSEMKLPVDENFLQKKDQVKDLLKDPFHHEMWMVALEWVGLSSLRWQEYFGLSLELSKRFSRWAQLSRSFHALKPEEFQGEFEDVLKNDNFEKLFDWYFMTKQILQKNSNLPLMEMIENWLPDWTHLYRFEALKDVKHIDPPLRAKYQVWNICQRL